MGVAADETCGAPAGPGAGPGPQLVGAERRQVRAGAQRLRLDARAGRDLDDLPTTDQLAREVSERLFRTRSPVDHPPRAQPPLVEHQPIANELEGPHVATTGQEPKNAMPVQALCQGATVPATKQSPHVSTLAPCRSERHGEGHPPPAEG